MLTWRLLIKLSPVSTWLACCRASRRCQVGLPALATAIRSMCGCTMISIRSKCKFPLDGMILTGAFGLKGKTSLGVCSGRLQTRTAFITHGRLQALFLGPPTISHPTLDISSFSMHCARISWRSASSMGVMIMRTRSTAGSMIYSLSVADRGVRNGCSWRRYRRMISSRFLFSFRPRL